MRTLVIDSATEACSVALFDNDVLVAGALQMLGRGHAEQLVPMISALPDNGKAQAIRVNIGPGSFTGIRVGLAAARALAFAWQADLTGYGSLDLVAAMARDNAPVVDVAMQGGHGEWFFLADGDADVASLTPEQAAAQSSAGLVSGSMAQKLADLRGDAPATLPLWPDAREALRLPETALIRPAQPLYGRAPDAKLPVNTAISVSS